MKPDQRNYIVADDSSGVDMRGYSVWEFTGAEWKLKKHCPVNGSLPSDPPAFKGKFKGQLRAIPCGATCA